MIEEICVAPWASSGSSGSFEVLRRSSLSVLDGCPSSSHVTLDPGTLSYRPVGNSTFAVALVASTFFTSATANSTHARVRPIAFILGPVYHHLNVLIDIDGPFSSRTTIPFICRLRPQSSLLGLRTMHEIRVIRTGTSNRVMPSNDHRAVRTRRRITRPYARRPSAQRAVLSDSSLAATLPPALLRRIWGTPARIILALCQKAPAQHPRVSATVRSRDTFSIGTRRENGFSAEFQRRSISISIEQQLLVRSFTRNILRR